MKKSLIIAAGLAIGMVGLFIITKEGETINTGTAKPVVTQVVEEGIFSDRNTFGAFVQSTDEAVVSAQLGGSVSKIYVKEGETVKKGQTLMRISAPELAAQYKTMNINVQRAYESEKDERRRDWDDKTKEQKEMQRLSSRKAEAARDEVGALLSKATVRAPFSGVVARVDIKEGSTVMPGRSLIYIISDKNEKEISVAVPVSIGKNVEIKEEILVKTGAESALARVTEISPLVDSISRKMVIKLLIGDNNFVLGEFVEVEFLNKNSSQTASSIPSEAVIKKYDDEFVAVVVEDVVKFQTVKVISDDDENVIVTGLVSGMEIVIKGVHRLIEGGLVEILED